MSTTTAHPAPTAGPGPEHPSGTLPVLAVDLVTYRYKFQRYIKV